MADPVPLFAGPLPTLDTPRLRLRPFTAGDAPEVQAHLGDSRIAEMTLTIPHPYPPGAAAEFIARQAESWRSGKGATWALTESTSGRLVGAIGLKLTLAHRRAEAGYWIAVGDWDRGYATESLRRTIAFAFDDLDLHRVEAHHFVGNDASGRVMQRCGMRHEGVVRGAVFRDGTPRDLSLYGILRTDPWL